MSHEIMAWVFTAFVFGVAVGFVYAPRKPEPADLDVTMERYRDAATTFAEAVLSGFGSTTQWDKFRQAREAYLTEARED